MHKLYYPPVHFNICTTFFERILIPKLDFRIKFFAQLGFLSTKSSNSKLGLKIINCRTDGLHETNSPFSRHLVRPLLISGGAFFLCYSSKDLLFSKQQVQGRRGSISVDVSSKASTFRLYLSQTSVGYARTDNKPNGSLQAKNRAN